MRLRARVRSLLLAVAAVLGLGCGAPPPTEILVVVDTDLSIPDEIDRIVFEVAGGSPPASVRSLASDAELPVTLALASRSNSGTVTVLVRGELSGSAVIERTATATFEPGRIRVLRLDLLAGCAGATCPAGQSCGASGCETPQLEPWAGSASRLTCTSQPAGCRAFLLAWRDGSGNGTISSADGRIGCGETCAARYDPTAATNVTLTAIPDRGSTFVAWGDDCAGVTGPCTLRMNVDRAASATFLGGAVIDAWGIPASTESWAIDVAVDSAGDVVLAGRFAGTIAYGGSHRATSMGAGDVFVVKYHPDGTFVWAREIGDTGEDVAHALAIGPNNEIVVAGEFDGSWPGARSAGFADVFVLKLDAAGNPAGVFTMGSLNSDGAAGVAVAPDGSIAVTGYLGGTTTFGGSTLASSTTVTPFGYVARLNRDLAPLWAYAFSPRASAFGLGVDAPGDIWVAGSYGVDVLLGGVAGETGLTANGLSQDGFVARYAPDGTLLAARSIGGPGRDDATRVVVDRSTGDVYVGGTFLDSVDFGNGVFIAQAVGGGIDVWVARFLASRLIADWAIGFGSDGPELVGGLALDPYGGLAVAGYYGSLSIDIPGFGTLENADPTASTFDAFVVKLQAADGTVAWARSFGSTDQDAAASIAADASGEWWICGEFVGASTDIGGISVPGAAAGTAFFAHLGY